MQAECINSEKPESMKKKYKELQEKIEEEIGLRITHDLKRISMILKRSRKLIEDSRLRNSKI